MKYMDNVSNAQDSTVEVEWLLSYNKWYQSFGSIDYKDN